MQFSSVLLALSAVTGVFASNAFSSPIGNETLTAGSTFIIRWNNTGGGATVDLLLKEGKAEDLKTALTISTGLSNVGAVRWFLPEDLVTGSDYALSITNKDNGDINYSPFFTIIGQNKTTSSSSSSSSAKPTSSSVNSTSDSATAGHNSTSSTGFTNSTASHTSTKTTGTGSASATKSSSTGTSTSTGSASTNGASFVSYSSLMLAAGIAGAAFMAM